MQPSILTYADFVRMFRDRFLPEVRGDELQQDLLNLRQGTMTVTEYEIRFIQLSQHAPSVVAREKDRCRHFEEGLNYEIWSQLMPGDLRNYSDLRTSSFSAEKLQKEKERGMASPKSKRTDGRLGGESSVRPGKRPGYGTLTQIYGSEEGPGFSGSRSPAVGPSGGRKRGTPI